MKNPYLSVKEVAAFLHLHKKTIERWCREGKLKTAHRIGRHWFIYKDQFKDWSDA